MIVGRRGRALRFAPLPHVLDRPRHERKAPRVFARLSATDSFMLGPGGRRETESRLCGVLVLIEPGLVEVGRRAVCLEVNGGVDVLVDGEGVAVQRD